MYTPENIHLEELLNEAAKSLELEGAIGVNNSEELVELIANRGLVAGVEFKHPAVSISDYSLFIFSRIDQQKHLSHLNRSLSIHSP